MPFDQPTCDLATALAARIEAIARLCALSRPPSHHVRCGYVSAVMREAGSAVATGEMASLEAATRSMDLLSFELCEE